MVFGQRDVKLSRSRSASGKLRGFIPVESGAHLVNRQNSKTDKGSIRISGRVLLQALSFIQTLIYLRCFLLFLCCPYFGKQITIFLRKAQQSGE